MYRLSAVRRVTQENKGKRTAEEGLRRLPLRAQSRQVYRFRWASGSPPGDPSVRGTGPGERFVSNASIRRPLYLRVVLWTSLVAVSRAKRMHPFIVQLITMAPNAPDVVAQEMQGDRRLASKRGDFMDVAFRRQ